jgi:glutamate synthase (NADPH/NADH) small chain
MMQRFHQLAQNYPETRDATERIRDSDEIYHEFASLKAAEQSSRCLQCGVPFCQVHCPLHNNIPDWLKLVAEGRLKEAYEVSSATNNFPEICGRICPQDKLCEGNCVVNKDFGAITIGAVEKYITETAWKEGWVTGFAPLQEQPFSVAIIGSGPAGLAAAEVLRRKGIQVHIYDRHDRAGGLLIYGIPNFKLDKKIVSRRIAQYSQSGIQFHLGVEIGRDIALRELHARHDAVLLSTGVYKARALEPMPGLVLPGVLPALDFLIESNRAGLEGRTSKIPAQGKHIVVIGGGDTAMDCVRTAVRQGAASVTCVYRRDRENMPGSAREVYHAEEEGVKFRFMSAPLEFRGHGKIEQVVVGTMRLGPVDISGRRLPELIAGEKTTMNADLVIKALGFDAEDFPLLFSMPELQLTPHGTLKVDAHGMTSVTGIFAAGDNVRGASLVVWAIADGRKVAAHILDYLSLKPAARVA